MRWMIYGVLSTLLFGMWGLFEKLSSFQSPFTSNIIVYLAVMFSASLAIIVFTRRLKFSKNGVLAGLFAGIANFFFLYALLNNMLILVMPFVSAAGIVFFVAMFLVERPKYTPRQKLFAGTGLFLSFLGIFTVASGSAGFSNFLSQLTLDASYLTSAVIAAVGFGLWTYFTYRSASEKKVDGTSYVFWYSLAPLAFAGAAAMLFRPETITEIFSFASLGYAYPVLAGVSAAAGCFLTFAAFKSTTTKTKLQEVIVAVLANGELIPLMLFSYFLLGERTMEGFVGTLFVLAGLFTLNYSETLK